MMSLWRRFLPEIPSAAYPRELKPATCRLLRLNVSYLVSKDHGLEYVSEDSLMPGNQVVMRLVHYEAVSEHASGFGVILHPPVRGRVEPERWLEDFDARYPDLSLHWRRILEEQPTKILRQMRSYGDETLTGEGFFSALVLWKLKIAVDSDAELVFEPAWPLDSLNLRVSISRRGRVVAASFGG